MKRFAMKILVALGLSLGVGPNLAYADAQSCLEGHFIQVAKGEENLGFAPSDIEKMVSEIAEKIGLSMDGITVVSCPDGDVEKVQSWYSPGNSAVPIGDYITYDPTWVREVIGTDQVQATALFGHELAHLLGRHFTSAKSMPRLKKETFADRFAGCAVARKGYGWQPLADLLSRLRGDNDSSYPSREHSLTAARKGFDECGGVYEKGTIVEKGTGDFFSPPDLETEKKALPLRLKITNTCAEDRVSASIRWIDPATQKNFSYYLTLNKNKRPGAQKEFTIGDATYYFLYARTESVPQRTLVEGNGNDPDFFTNATKNEYRKFRRITKRDFNIECR